MSLSVSWCERNSRFSGKNPRELKYVTRKFCLVWFLFIGSKNTWSLEFTSDDGCRCLTGLFLHHALSDHGTVVLLSALRHLVVSLMPEQRIERWCHVTKTQARRSEATRRRGRGWAPCLSMLKSCKASQNKSHIQRAVSESLIPSLENTSYKHFTFTSNLSHPTVESVFFCCFF